MQRFDCLAKDCPLLGPHLLEASAGTGKTFSIEHIYVRLILESVDVEQILAVTFTRAATRELKARIRSNLEKALESLRTLKAPWPYLETHLGSEEATRKLNEALSGFDRCQIFTIHGFCYRMLKEFAFEAKIALSLPNPDEKMTPKRLREAASDFLENGIDPSLLCPEQCASLTKDFDSKEEIEKKLLRLEKVEANASFKEISEQCKAALHHWNVEESKLMEDFQNLKMNYRAKDGDHELQVKALAHLEDPQAIRILMKEKGSLFKFLDPANKKVKTQDPFLHYPGFFDSARTHIAHLLNQKVLPTLQAAWNPIAEKILSEEEHLNPDEILISMKKAVENPLFADLIAKKFAAVIIDEFQDTDAVQWDIFQSLFFKNDLKALYLVGDPKQSIYRFRKADVYTYLKARDFLGDAHLYQLDTNFRSSKPLIGALNALFQREWLKLPKVNRTLPYHPVRAGAEIENNFGDDKGSLHFLVASGEPTPLFEELFLPYAAREIERLNLKKCAILIKDRFQAEKALSFLKERGIQAIAKSHTPLGQTVAFQAIRELFEAILSPHNQSAIKVVMAGPFGPHELPLQDYKVLLEEKGLVALARELKDRLDSDALQIFELLFEWEKSEGFSFEGLKRILRELPKIDPEEGASRRMEVDDEAVQIMTLHISKGLEFDVVFALGLISRTPAPEKEIEELDAEKMRQLYVAMTRAKKRLYVPLITDSKESDQGTRSPMELFSEHFEGPLVEQIATIAKTESITIESLSSPLLLPPSAKTAPVYHTAAPLKPRPFTPAYLSSFTMLAKTKESDVKWAEADPLEFNLQTMPRGAETGITVHKIFELLFSSSKPIWRDPKAIHQLVEEQLRFSPLLPWENAIRNMVEQTVLMPLQADGEFFSLSEVDQFQVESEFVFTRSPDYIKGFIDLIFCYRGKIYFLDYKTNWLENYGMESLQACMEAHDYHLQASLYAEAIQRQFSIPFGGAFYLFVRGLASYFCRGI